MPCSDPIYSNMSKSYQIFCVTLYQINISFDSIRRSLMLYHLCFRLKKIKFNIHKQQDFKVVTSIDLLKSNYIIGKMKINP